MIQFADIQAAVEVVTPHIVTQNLWYSKKLSTFLKGDVYLKLENIQETGSFKIRGAINAVSALSSEQRACGVIAASGGNHAQGIAWACAIQGINCTIVLPVNAPKEKIKATKQLGAQIILAGNCFDEASQEAFRIHQETGAILIDGENNDLVIAGQGTISCELFQELKTIDNIIVPVGGGGLISGISLAAKHYSSKVKVYGVESEVVSCVSSALRAKRPVVVDSQPTIADGINVHKIGEQAFEIISNYVDQVVGVKEEEIASAILYMLEKEKQVVEGAGAVGVAAILHNKIKIKPNQKTVIIISGGNMDVTLLGDIIEHGLITMNRRICFSVVVSNQPGALEEMLQNIEANIVTIIPTRRSAKTMVNTQIIDLVVDVLDREQAVSILNQLKIRGYKILDEE